MKPNDPNRSINEQPPSNAGARQPAPGDVGRFATNRNDLETADAAAADTDHAEPHNNELQHDNADVVDDFTECVQLIDRVKEGIPECLADLTTPSAEGMWLSGEGDHPPQIGRFQIHRKLGEGGFGLVFLARDPDLERDLALKVPRVETLVTDSTRERFLGEGRAAAKLSHPAIATVYESGRIGPICYIASEFCGGGTLADWLREYRSTTSRLLAPTAAAQLIQTLAEAVQYSHSRGILHRDLKPNNVMLAEPLPTSGDSRTTAELENELATTTRIVDFGLAKSLDDASDRTRSGAILGTPRYMSPEQTTGDLERIGPASDVYSLGAMLYEVVCGVAPFANVPDASLTPTVLKDDPQPLRRHVPACPRDLEAICLKCLEKDPQRRYASAAELVADLERFRTGATVKARPVTAWQRCTRWCGRNPMVASLTASVVLLLLTTSVVLGVSYWRTNSILREKLAALEDTRKARLETLRRYELAQQVVDDYLVATSDDERLKVEALQPLRRELLERAKEYYQQLRTEGATDPSLESAYALALWRLAVLYRQTGDFKAAEATHADSVTIFEKLVKQTPNNLALLNRLGRGYLDSGLVHFRQMDGPSAAPHWRKAFELYDAIPDQRLQQAEAELQKSVQQNASTAHENLGMLHIMANEFADAERYYQQSLKLRKGLLERFPDDLSSYGMAANSHVNLGLLYRKQSKTAERIEQLTEAANLLRSALKDHPNDIRLRSDFATDLVHLSMAYQDQRDSAQAMQLQRESVEVLEKLCFDQPLIPEYKLRLAQLCINISINKAWSDEERIAHRLRCGDLLVEVRRRHPQQPIDYQLDFSLQMNTAVAHRSAGEIEAARSSFQTAVEICDAQLTEAPSPTVHLSRANAIYCLAHLEFDDPSVESTLPLLDESTAALEKLAKLSPAPPRAVNWLARNYVQRAQICERLGRSEQAHEDRMRAAGMGHRVKHSDEVYELTRRLADGPNDVKLLCRRARRWYSRNDYAQAIADSSRAIELAPDHSQAYLLRAWSYVNNYQFAEAIRDYEEATERGNDNAWMRRDRAWLYAVSPAPLANAELAVEHARAAVEMAKRDDARLISLSTLGVAHYHHGDTEAALNAFAKMKSTTPHPESLYYLALCHLRLDDADKASKYFEQAHQSREGYRRFEGELEDMKPYLDRLHDKVAAALAAALAAAE